MSWFLMGWHYGLVAMGVIAAFVAALLAVLLLTGLLGLVVGLIGGESEDEE